ncbi:polypyrimidine tract-binding protein homolog 3 [Tanacetum coccineum]|uniref:Polypyrimidine tract-binding protein homolog 3 n=1 Tax=Tanacetum coccineum TaxID=301880 RepID=A0ABQ5EUM2_9ASTR
MNSDIEDDVMDPIMQCTTFPSHSSFSQQKLVSFVTEIHTTSIDFLTPREAFSLARIAEACFEDERSTIAIAKPNELTTRVHVQNLKQTTQGRGDEPNHIILVMIHHMIYPINVEVLNQIFSPHGYVEKVVIFQNDVDESETSGPETPAKEVVDNGNGSALIFLVGYGTGSEVVTGLPKEFQEGYMVDALSRVLEHKILEKVGDICIEKQDYALFGALLFAFLNLGPGSFAHKRI